MAANDASRKVRRTVVISDVMATNRCFRWRHEFATDARLGMRVPCIWPIAQW